jgi:hypothetical protein
MRSAAVRPSIPSATEKRCRIKKEEDSPPLPKARTALAL